MLADKIRILNFDDSLTKQNNLIQRFSPIITDLKKIAPACRHWMSKKVAQKLKGLLDPEVKNTITFLGSGDFHHISELLIEQFQIPLGVVVFDHHPDWDTLPPRLSCGSWVNRILERRSVLKVILLGVSSDDISPPGITTANLNSLRGNRVEIYPYFHRPTRVLFRNVPENISITLSRRLFYSDIYWQQLKDNNLRDFFSQLTTRIAMPQVYISIDKDCLKSAYSLTNWEEGRFELEELLIMLNLIKEKYDIVGLDITGDYSQVELRGTIKAFCSRLDHPKDYTAKDKSEALINSINEQTNIRILQALKN